MPKRFRLVLAAHLISLPVATIAAYGVALPNPADVVCLSLIFAESGLLGFWGGMSPARQWGRYVMILFGLVGLWTAAIASEGFRVEPIESIMIGLVIVLPAVIVFLILKVLQSNKISYV